MNTAVTFFIKLNEFLSFVLSGAEWGDYIELKGNMVVGDAKKTNSGPNGRNFKKTM